MPRLFDVEPKLPSPDGTTPEVLHTPTGLYFHDMLIALGHRPILERIAQNESITRLALTNEELARLQAKGEEYPFVVAGNRIQRAILHLSPNHITATYGSGELSITHNGRAIHNFLTDVLRNSPVSEQKVVNIFSAINPRFGLRRDRFKSQEEKPIRNIRILWYFLFRDSATAPDLQETLQLGSRSPIAEIYRQFPDLFTKSYQLDQKAYVLSLTTQGQQIRNTILLPLWREAQKATAYL